MNQDEIWVEVYRYEFLLVTYAWEYGAAALIPGQLQIDYMQASMHTAARVWYTHIYIYMFIYVYILYIYIYIYIYKR